ILVAWLGGFNKSFKFQPDSLDLASRVQLFFFAFQKSLSDEKLGSEGYCENRLLMFLANKEQDSMLCLRSMLDLRQKHYEAIQDVKKIYNKTVHI
ncbi:hypothetical protein WA026_002506, partial [Henosepilachna vigintioctopunctata]